MCKTIALSVLLYGCATLRDEHKLRVFEKRMFRRIFGSKTEEEGPWR
jgi:hypothetical protein